MRSNRAPLVVLALLAGLISAAAADPARLTASDDGHTLDTTPVTCGGAVSTVDQSFESDMLRFDWDWKPFTVRPFDRAGGVAIAQTVTAGRGGLLTTVEVHFVGWSVLGDLPVEVREKRPDGRLLARGVMPLSAFEQWRSATQHVGSPAWLQIPLEPAVRVSRGDVIAIVMPAMAGTQNANSLLPTMVRWYTSVGGYPGGASFAGTRVGNDPGVSSWEQFPNDRHFRTHVCELPPTSIAAPRAAALSGDTGAGAELLVLLAFMLGAAGMLRWLGRPPHGGAVQVGGREKTGAEPLRPRQRPVSGRV